MASGNPGPSRLTMNAVSGHHHNNTEGIQQINSQSISITPPMPNLQNLAAAANNFSDAAKKLEEMVSWDPTEGNKSSEELTISFEVKRRIHGELCQYFKDPPPGILLVPDEHNLSVFHSIVIGPADTPYEGGFFYFYIKLPHNYPWNPPKVKLMTTGNGKVRFNPNLYACGKVCLSILGTWAGPSWSPSITLPALLVSIQSLLNSEPFYNEPGYERRKRGDNSGFSIMSQEYTNEVRFHTLRVAILDMVEGVNSDTKELPDGYKKKLISLFLENYETYLRIITANLESTKFAYPKLLTRLVELKAKFESPLTN